MVLKVGIFTNLSHAFITYFEKYFAERFRSKLVLNYTETYIFTKIDAQTKTTSVELPRGIASKLYDFV